MRGRWRSVSRATHVHRGCWHDIKCGLHVFVLASSPLHCTPSESCAFENVHLHTLFCSSASPYFYPSYRASFSSSCVIRETTQTGCPGCTRAFLYLSI